VASFIPSQACNVGFWHKADNLGTAAICPLLDKSGQWSAPLLNGLVANANDPNRSSPAFDPDQYRLIVHLLAQVLPSAQRSGGVLALSPRRAGAFIFSR
jgi:hypothetical protein